MARCSGQHGDSAFMFSRILDVQRETTENHNVYELRRTSHLLQQQAAFLFAISAARMFVAIGIDGLTHRGAATTMQSADVTPGPADIPHIRGLMRAVVV